MIKSKFLSDAGWKDVAAKSKVKDPGLLKVLEKLKKLDDDQHDEASDALDQVLKLTVQLKKDKSIAAVPAVAKYIAEVTSAAETAAREVSKAKVEREKAMKAKAEAEKKAASKKDDEDEDDDEAESPELLTSKLKPLLKLVAKGEMMHALVAKSGKQVAVMMSRKPIPPARRKMLSEQLGGGSTKFFPGHCSLEAGVTTFVLKAEVAGMSKLIKLALLQQTGLRLNKVKCRGEDGDDDDDDEGGVPAPRDEGDGEEPQAPDRDSVDVEDLVKAPEMWQGTRDLLQYNVDALRRAIQEQTEGEGEDFVAEIQGNLAKLDRVFERLDQRLSDSLAKARDAGSDDDRRAELEISRVILEDYIRYVNSEPLIAHLDNNPFGVATNLQATLGGSLMQLAKAIG